MWKEEKGAEEMMFAVGGIPGSTARGLCPISPLTGTAPIFKGASDAER